MVLFRFGVLACPFLAVAMFFPFFCVSLFSSSILSRRRYIPVREWTPVGQAVTELHRFETKFRSISDMDEAARETKR